MIRPFAAVGIAMLCAGAWTAAVAQAPPGAPGRGPGAANGPYGSPPATGQPANPFQTGSNLRGLLIRPEVQQEIGLDLKQRNALAAIQDEPANAIRDKVKAAMQGQDPQFRAMSPEQRRAWMMQQQRMLAQAQAAQQTDGELSDKMLKILTPEQIARLHELDLQKRGPLALGDPRVQEELKLNSQTRTAESRILQDYQLAMRTIIADTMQEATLNGGARQGNAPDFYSRLSPLRKKLVANREQAEKRAVDTLTDEEKEAWTKLQGKPFKFRADPAPPQTRQQPGQFRPGMQ